jgi:DNA-directed RNA polymerase specialized sigma24 family protein
MKATNTLPTHRATYQQLREDQAVKREREATRAMFNVDKRNARIAEIMAMHRADEMQEATFLLGVIHHIDAGHPGYRRLAAACEAEGLDWREIVKRPGRIVKRTPDAIAKREAVIVRLRATGMSYPEIGAVMGQSHTTVMQACKRMERA